MRADGRRPVETVDDQARRMIAARVASLPAALVITFYLCPVRHF